MSRSIIKPCGSFLKSSVDLLGVLLLFIHLVSLGYCLPNLFFGCAFVDHFSLVKSYLDIWYPSLPARLVCCDLFSGSNLCTKNLMEHFIARQQVFSLGIIGSVQYVLNVIYSESWKFILNHFQFVHFCRLGHCCLWTWFAHLGISLARFYKFNVNLFWF